MLEIIQIYGNSPEIKLATNEDHTQSEKRYKAQIELNLVDQDSSGVIGNNKLRITDKTDYSDLENHETVEESSSDKNNQGHMLNLRVLDLISGETLSVDEEGNFPVNNQGVIIDLSNLEKIRKYKIYIENVEVAEKYDKSINSLTLEVSVDESENIVAQIIEITDASDQRINPVGQIFANLHEANENGIVTINPDKQNPSIQIQYKEENEENWHDYSEPVKIEKNETIEARAMRDGIVSEVSVKVIDNIDKQPPQVQEIVEENGSHTREVVVKAKLIDNESGLVKYGISTSDDEEPDRYIMADEKLTEQDILDHRNIDPMKEAEAEIDAIHENGEHYIWVWDTAGNCTKQPINIQKVTVIPVAEIVKVSDSQYSELEHTQYETLREAIEKSPEGVETTIKLLAEIYNENNEIDNRNITLNLDGHTLNSKSTKKPTLTVNGNASLTVVNVDDDNVTHIDGLISSESTCVIYAKASSTLTLRNFR